MKNNILLISLLTSATLFSQVGINTETPKATLDVVGFPADTSKLDGVIAPRITGNLLRLKTYTAAQNGAIVYVTAADSSPAGQTINVKSIGYYFFDSITMTWLKLAVQESTFQLFEAFFKEATAPVDTPAGTSDNTNLGLSITATIPANSTIKVILNYSVPMGTYPIGATTGGSDPNDNVNGYFGIRFLKNGTEVQAGSRKNIVPFGSAGTNMNTVGANYVEEITNSTSSPIVVTYTLNGYVEGTFTATRFNMWASSGANFNWGKGTISVTTFIKRN